MIVEITRDAHDYGRGAFAMSDFSQLRRRVRTYNTSVLKKRKKKTKTSFFKTGKRKKVKLL